MQYRLKDGELDAARFELRRGGRAVPIEPQVLELLLYLVAHRDRAVTRSELFEQLWRGRIVTDSALNSRIKAARAAIGDDGASQSQIRTLHRTGYRFVGDVAEVSEAASMPKDVPNATPAAPPDLPRVTGRFVPRRLGAIGAALGLLLAVGAFALLPRDSREVRSPAVAVAADPARPPATAAAAAPKSLAVLPFTSLSPDAEQEYFADSIGVELLNVLSRLPDLQVIGRTSSAYFKGRDESLREIGETLGVAHLLTGSVRKSGERVRIAVELVDADSGYQLWSDSYDRELGDIFDVQDEIAERVATALQVKLGLGVSGEIGMTRNVAAYDEFLRGVALYSEYRTESFPRAIEHMHRAIALDPSFSRAWAYLYCIYRDGRVAVPQRTEEWSRRAVEALAKARELTPDAPFVRVLDAREDMHLGRRLEARAVLDALPAGYWTGDRNLTRDVFRGRFLIGTGHAKEAIEALERARAADPLSPVIALFLGVAHAIDDNPADALAETERGLDLGYFHPLFLGSAMLIALGSGDHDQIRRRAAAVSLEGAEHRAINDALIRHLADPAKGRAEVRRIAATPSPPDLFRTLMIVHWAAYYGDPELALEMLNAIAPGAADDGLLWRPVMSEVRKLAGFKDLVRREGLVDYWRAHGWPEFCRATTADDFECG
jgi:TolB-like protein/DNA-binding winged helix-turn-helix (wHTH) protein